MTKQVNQFEIKEDVNLIFQSKGKLYQMRLLISTGLIFLSELEKDKKNEERIIFIDKGYEYTGERVVPTEKVESTENKEVKPVKKKRKKVLTSLK